MNLGDSKPRPVPPNGGAANHVDYRGDTLVK